MREGLTPLCNSNPMKTTVHVQRDPAEHYKVVLKHRSGQPKVLHDLKVKKGKVRSDPEVFFGRSNPRAPDQGVYVRLRDADHEDLRMVIDFLTQLRMQMRLGAPSPEALMNDLIKKEIAVDASRDAFVTDLVDRGVVEETKRPRKRGKRRTIKHIGTVPGEDVRHFLGSLTTSDANAGDAVYTHEYSAPGPKVDPRVKSVRLAKDLRSVEVGFTSEKDRDSFRGDLEAAGMTDRAPVTKKRVKRKAKGEAAQALGEEIDAGLADVKAGRVVPLSAVKKAIPRKSRVTTKRKAKKSKKA